MGRTRNETNDALRSFPANSSPPPLIGPTAAPLLQVMTLNIRRHMPGFWFPVADRWARRRPVLKQLLAAEQPAVLALQEVMPGPSREIRAMRGAAYESVGTGRSTGGRGERCELHYDRHRLCLLDSRFWWLSAHPERPGSRSFGNQLPRFVVQGHFSDRETGARFHVLVTHLDPFSAPSRSASAQLLHRVVADLPDPVILMGDFNAGTDSPAHRELVDDLVLTDAMEVSKRRVGADCSTFTRYRSPTANGPRLDWILVSPGLQVESAGVNALRIGGAAVSDHEPVQAVLNLGPSLAANLEGALSSKL